MSPAPDPADPGTDGTAPAGRQWSRRWFLAGGAAAVVGGGAGVGAGFLQHRSRPAPKPAPAALVAAVAAERALLALATAAPGHDASVRAVAALLTSDHAAHLHALESSLAAYDTPRAAAAVPASFAGTSSVRDQLRAAESAAAGAAGTRAQQLTGPVATLLASIAACESTHVELLS